MSLANNKPFSPGFLEKLVSSKDQTKENLRVDQLIPFEILNRSPELLKLLKAYYTFLNLDEFLYDQTETFTGIVLDDKVTFRVSDPNNENDHFFTDQQGSSSTLVVTSPAGVSTTIALTSGDIAITNGNELPGSLSTLEGVGKTYTVKPRVDDQGNLEGTNLLAAYNGFSAKLTTPIKYYAGPGPSYVMNTIESAMDIDVNSENYLKLQQKEIAPAVPFSILSNKRTLYKNIIEFYKLRGSTESIEIFFRLLFEENVEISFPYDNTLIPSAGTFTQEESTTAVLNGAVTNSTTLVITAANSNIQIGSQIIAGTQVPRSYKDSNDNSIIVESISSNGLTITVSSAVTITDGTTVTFEPRGSFTTNKGMLSEKKIRIHDSLRYQRFSYLIKTARNIEDWEYVFDRLVHPSGFIYFAEILLTILLTSVNTTDGDLTIKTSSKFKQIAADTRLNSAMPGIVPGLTIDDIPIIVEAFASSFNPTVIAKIYKAATFSVTLNGSGGLSNLEVIEPGYGYSAVPTLTFNGEGTSTVNPTVTLALTSDGQIDVDNITIDSAGSGFTNLFITASAPVDGSNNSLLGQIAEVIFYGLADKQYTVAPTLIFDAPTSRDADGNLLSTNVTETATVTLDSDNEISAITLGGVGRGYALDPEVRIKSLIQNEDRVKHDTMISKILCNNQDDGSDLIVANKYFNRKKDNFYTTARLFSGGQTIQFFGDQTIQTIDSTDINKYNTNATIHIE